MTSQALTASELHALRRTTVASLTVGVLVAAGLLVTFWVLLHPVQSDGCTTSLLASPFKTALVPAHLAAAAALSVCVWMLSARRRRRRLPAKPTLWLLGAAWVYALASVIDHDLFGPTAMASVLAAPTVGLVGLFMLVVRTVVALRSPQLTPTRWQQHAFATQVLLWGAFLIGLPANLTYAWLSGANFFCFKHGIIWSMDLDWTMCDSRAVEAYRYLPQDAVLQIVFRQGRHAYDSPCDAAMFEAFVNAASKGRFVDRVLKPAQRLGWSRPPWIWRG